MSVDAVVRRKFEYLTVHGPVSVEVLVRTDRNRSAMHYVTDEDMIAALEAICGGHDHEDESR